ncbi:MAG: hypothetical protein ACJ8EI_03600 [Sphingomicrobium sp.]
MTKSIAGLGFALVIAGGVAFAATADQAPPAAGVPEQPKICKKVVDATPGSKPYDLCMTKAEWDAKKIADAKDPNRMVCHYEEQMGTRFRSNKVCMTAMEWENARQADRREVERIQMQTCVPGAGC